MMIRKQISGNQAILVRNLHQLEHLASLLSKQVASGDFIALTGSLGTGKTTFTQFFSKALGVTNVVTSPTFTLLNEYAASHIKLIHADFYRLDEHNIEPILEELEDSLEKGESLALVEWADKAPQLKQRWNWHIDFAFTSDNESERLVSIESSDYDKLEELMKAVHNEF